MTDLFQKKIGDTEEIQTDVYVLRQLTGANELIAEVKRLIKAAPFRYMRTPGGKRLNISMSNCGDLGWISEPSGYRYSRIDPTSGKVWPAMPQKFKQLSEQAAQCCGFDGFNPNACLINHYHAGKELTAHQDKNEVDLAQPIVSVSLGMSAHFQIYGDSRNNKAVEIELYDGDVMVWGRSARLIYHGVKTNRSIPHPTLGNHRINLTFRKA